MSRRLERSVLSATLFANAKAKRLAIRLTRWTGKSREYVHPKHLLGDTPEHYWYLEHLAPGATLLDVGCGNGMHTLKAARRCADVAGVDADLASLGVGLRTAQRLGMTNVAFVAANVEEGLPIAPARFDMVLCLDLLEHVHKRDLVLTEIRRVLKPAGVLLLAVPNRATAWKRRLERADLPFYSDPDHKIEYTLLRLYLSAATSAAMCAAFSSWLTPASAYVRTTRPRKRGSYFKGARPSGSLPSQGFRLTC